MMWSEVIYLIPVVFIALLGLWGANLVLDYGWPQYISRKVGHGFGGLAYLMCLFFFSNPLWPIVLSLGFVFLLGGARLFRPSTFRGVGGSARAHAFAEVWFPLGGAFSLVVGWALLNNPALAVVPILYMSWGDGITGLIRARVYRKEVKGNLGSLGMIVVCLLIAFLFTPYWIAAIGAVVATAAERWTPISRGLFDDNWTVIVSSLLVMIFLGAIT